MLSREDAMLRRVAAPIFAPACQPVGGCRFKSKGHDPSWIQRHIRDPFVRKAAEEMYRTRSAYKLKQLDARFKFFKKDSVVIDLGCYAGGWSQVALERTGAGTGRPNSLVIGVDKVSIEPLEQHHFIRGDVNEAKTMSQVQQILKNRRATIVLSDMAPNMTGSGADDHYRSMDLARAALKFVKMFLDPGGWFIVKVFAGVDLDKFRAETEAEFGKVQATKPEASRAKSRELFLVCADYKKTIERAKTDDDPF